MMGKEVPHNPPLVDSVVLERVRELQGQGGGLQTVDPRDFVRVRGPT